MGSEISKKDITRLGFRSLKRRTKSAKAFQIKYENSKLSRFN